MRFFLATFDPKPEHTHSCWGVVLCWGWCEVQEWEGNAVMHIQQSSHACAFVSVQIIGIGLKICGYKCLGSECVYMCVIFGDCTGGLRWGNLVFCVKLSAVWLANFHRAFKTLRLSWLNGHLKSEACRRRECLVVGIISVLAVTRFDCWSSLLVGIRLVQTCDSRTWGTVASG